MATPSPGRMKYTTKYSTLQNPEAALPKEPYQYLSPQDPSIDPEVDPDNGPPPFIELVTVLSRGQPGFIAPTADEASYTASDIPNTHVAERYLIIHSKSLARTIKDVVQYYPGYMRLTGQIHIQC